MKPKSPFEPHLELRPEAFTVALSDISSAAPAHHAPSRPPPGNHAVEIPEVGGSTFTDTNPWARSGLNE